MRAWLLLLLFVLLLPKRALAWVEWHHEGDDVRVTVHKDGSLSVETVSRYDVSRGPIKTFDVQGIDERAVLDPELHVEKIASAPLAGAQPTSEQALAEYEGRIEPLPKRPDVAFEGQSVRFVLDGTPLGGTVRNGAIARGSRPQAGLGRGAYAITWRYRIAAKLEGAHPWLTREGARIRVQFQGTVAPEGYDSARVVFVVPSAPVPPRLAETAWGSSSASVRRGPGEDEIELIRPHIARAEAPKFAIELDPRALPEAAQPELRPPPPAPVESKTLRHVLWTLLALVSCALGVALTKLSPARALWPLRHRAWWIGALMGLSVAIEAVVGLGWSLGVAPLVLLLALSTGPRRAARGASWQPCELPPSPSWRTWLGLGAATLAPWALLPAALWLEGPMAGVSMWIRVCALLPLTFSLWPDFDELRMFAAARRAQESGVQVQCAYEESSGERRLLLLPQSPLEGMVGMEMGRCRAGVASLVRVEQGSCADRRLRSLWPHAAAEPARAGEAVYRLFAPAASAHGLRRVLSVVEMAFGERRTQRAAVRQERRSAGSSVTITAAAAAGS